MIKNLIIPLAGLGSRFKKENFSTIKPLITIDKNNCIFDNKTSNFIFWEIKMFLLILLRLILILLKLI